MARVSFVVRNTSAASGSFLRYPDGSASVSLFPSRTDYDSSLRADGFQLAPASTGDSTFSVDAITYGKSLLTWTAPLVAVSTSPLPTSVQIVYSPQGAPQTVASGTVLVDTSLSSGTYSHADLPSGKWAYYSLFIHYTSTAGDDYYVKSAELEILIPTDYGSTIKLWDQLPSYVKSQDIALGDFNFSSDIGQTHGDAVGPLFKYLSIIGYDMDYMRTLIDYHMVSHDPNEAESEALNQLAITMGIPLTSGQLGSSRLRSILDNIGIYRRAKGTPAAVNLMLGAVSGSNSTYNATTHKYTLQSQRANYVTVPKTGTGLTTWRESYPGESTAGTALNILRGAEFFIDAGRAVNAEQAALNQGTGGSALNARYGTGTGVDASDPLLLTHTGTNYMYLPGVAGNTAIIPDNPSLTLTGNIEVVMRLSLTDWTPATSQYLIAKWSNTAKFAWSIYVNITTGQPIFTWSPDGTSGSVLATAVAPSTALPDGVPVWIRAKFNISNRQLSFEWAADSPTEPTSWGTAALGTSGAATTIAATAAPLEIGSTDSGGGSNLLNGKVYRAILRNGFAGPTVVDVDFTTGLTSGNQVSVPFTGTGLATSTPQYVSNLGTGGRALVARSGSTPSTGTDDPLLFPWTGENYLGLANVNGNHAYAPHIAAYNLGTTNDLEVVARVSNNAWSLASGERLIAAKPYSSGGWYFSFNGNKQFVLGYSVSASAGTLLTGGSTVVAPPPVGTSKWVKVTRVASTGLISFYWAPDQTTEPSGATWIAIGTVSGASVTSGNLATNTNALGIGGSGSITNWDGGIYRAIVRDGVGGTTVLDANFTTGITSGAQTTFTESSANAATITISRSASGRKAVAVTRPTFLFGTDDYMEVADNDLLDFGATDSFTIVAAVRQWATPVTFGRYVDKKIDGGGVSQGWSLDSANTALQASLFLGDGTNQVSRTGSVYTAGTNLVTASVLDRSSATVTGYTNGTNNGSTSTVGLGSLVTNLPMRIGTQGGTLGGYQEFEMHGIAVFRKALTATEVALINTHYQGTETADSVALLSTAVFWIDPARSSQEMAINRSTAAGRKAVAVTRPTWLFGASSYMEVPDNDLLDFSDTDSFTVVGVVRQWGTTPADSRIVMKWSNAGGIQSGWYLTNGFSSPTQYMAVNGVSAGTASAVNTSATTGTVNTMIGVRNTATDQVTLYVNGVAGTALADSTVGTIANPGPMTIGRQDTGGAQYAQMELLAVAVFRRALTATEIATINTYYRTV